MSSDWRNILNRSIKSHFKNSERWKPNSPKDSSRPLEASLEDLTISSSGSRGPIESDDLIDLVLEEKERFLPIMDFKEPASFVKFGSAKKYYQDSIERIYSSFPYDGSLTERKQWLVESSLLDLYMFNVEYPKSTGYINIKPTTWGTKKAGSTYGLSDTPEYIFITGGPHADPTGDYKTGIPNKFDIDLKRESNLFLSSAGNAVEFWLQKEEMTESDRTWREVIFDCHTSEHTSSHTPAAGSPHARFRIELLQIPDSPPEWGITYKSGSIGMTTKTLKAGADILGTTWNHHAFSIHNNGSNLTVKYYNNGQFFDSVVVSTSESFGDVTTNLVATIGALAAPIDREHDDYGETGLGYGQFSGSLDDFRFWKAPRDEKQIGYNFKSHIYGGTNTVAYNTDLGIYYKFNEGISSIDTLDEQVLDYSGRISNGKLIGYNSNSRNTGSAITDYTSIQEEGDPVLYPDHPDVSSLYQSKTEVGEYFDYTNNSSLLNTIPSWLLDESLSESSVGRATLLELLQTVAFYFDTIFFQIKNLPQIKATEYYEFNNIDDEESLKPYPFMDRILSSFSFDPADIFANLSDQETILNRQDDVFFERDISEVKNFIYKNIYNNLIYIYKTKGTEKSFRNLIRCFGVDREVIDLIAYSDNYKYKLEDDFSFVTARTNAINFAAPNSAGASVYQNIGSFSDCYDYTPGINTSTRGHTISYSVNINFPAPLEFKAYESTSTMALSSSIFGVNTPEFLNTGVTTTLSPNHDLRLYAAKSFDTSLDSKLVVESTSMDFSLEGPVIPRAYQDRDFNVLVSVSPGSDFGSLVSGSSDKYTITLRGYSYISDQVEDFFEVSTEVDGSAAENFLSSNKRHYVGAEKLNLTGSVINSSDLKIVSFRKYLSNISPEEQKYHALDLEVFGLDNPMKDANLMVKDSQNYELNNYNSLVLNWQFEKVTKSDAEGSFGVYDLSSKQPGYGEVEDIKGNEYPGLGHNFDANDSRFILLHTRPAAKQALPETLFSSDMVNINTSEEGSEKFVKGSRPVNRIYSFEKNMYKTISEEMMKFVGSVASLGDLIGDPVNKYRESYKDLDKVRQHFFNFVEGDLDLEKYLIYYRWVDSALSHMIDQLKPLTVDFSEDIRNMVESHVFERSKYQHKFPTIEVHGVIPEAPLYGINELLYDWEHGHAPVSNTRAYATNILKFGGPTAADGDKFTISTPYPHLGINPSVVRITLVPNLSAPYDSVPESHIYIVRPSAPTTIRNRVRDVINGTLSDPSKASYGSDLSLASGVPSITAIDNGSYSLDLRANDYGEAGNDITLANIVGSSVQSSLFVGGTGGESNKDNCLWWKDRAERNETSSNNISNLIASGDTALDNNREQLRQFMNSDVTGSTYALRRFARPYRLSVERDFTYRAGHNFIKANKITNLFEDVQEFELSVKASDLTEKTTCSDIVLDPNEKKRLTGVFESSVDEEYLNTDSDFLLPFSIHSSSVDSGYVVGSGLYAIHKYADITNLHVDHTSKTGESPLQGVFTETHVGGNTHRHVYPCTEEFSGWTLADRPEEFAILIDSTEILFKDPTAAPWISRRSIAREGLTKRPVNIRNIKNKLTTSSLGNYDHDYEVVLSSGRNTRTLSDYEASFHITGSKNTDDHPHPDNVVDISNPERQPTKHIIVSKFSRIGGPGPRSNYLSDPIFGDVSPYNSMAYANLRARNAYNALLNEHSSQFGLRSGSMPIPAIDYDITSSFPDDDINLRPWLVPSVASSIHATNRNTEYVAAEGETRTIEARYDTSNVTYHIPRSDLQYSWISKSSNMTTSSFFGHESEYTIPNGSNGSTYNRLTFHDSSILGVTNLEIDTSFVEFGVRKSQEYQEVSDYLLSSNKSKIESDRRGLTIVNSNKESLALGFSNYEIKNGDTNHQNVFKYYLKKGGSDIYNSNFNSESDDSLPTNWSTYQLNGANWDAPTGGGSSGNVLPSIQTMTSGDVLYYDDFSIYPTGTLSHNWKTQACVGIGDAGECNINNQLAGCRTVTPPHGNSSFALVMDGPATANPPGSFTGQSGLYRWATLLQPFIPSSGSRGLGMGDGDITISFKFQTLGAAYDLDIPAIGGDAAINVTNDSPATGERLIVQYGTCDNLKTSAVPSAWTTIATYDNTSAQYDNTWTSVSHNISEPLTEGQIRNYQVIKFRFLQEAPNADAHDSHWFIQDLVIKHPLSGEKALVLQGGFEKSPSVISDVNPQIQFGALSTAGGSLLGATSPYYGGGDRKVELGALNITGACTMEFDVFCGSNRSITDFSPGHDTNAVTTGKGESDYLQNRVYNRAALVYENKFQYEWVPKRSGYSERRYGPENNPNTFMAYSGSLAAPIAKVAVGYGFSTNAVWPVRDDSLKYSSDFASLDDNVNSVSGWTLSPAHNEGVSQGITIDSYNNSTHGSDSVLVLKGTPLAAASLNPALDRGPADYNTGTKYWRSATLPYTQIAGSGSIIVYFDYYKGTAQDSNAGPAGASYLNLNAPETGDTLYLQWKTKNDTWAKANTAWSTDEPTSDDVYPAPGYARRVKVLIDRYLAGFLAPTDRIDLRWLSVSNTNATDSDHWGISNIKVYKSACFHPDYDPADELQYQAFLPPDQETGEDISLMGVTTAGPHIRVPTSGADPVHDYSGKKIFALAGMPVPYNGRLFGVGDSGHPASDEGDLPSGYSTDTGYGMDPQVFNSSEAHTTKQPIWLTGPARHQNFIEDPPSGPAGIGDADHYYRYVEIDQVFRNQVELEMYYAAAGGDIGEDFFGTGTTSGVANNNSPETASGQANEEFLWVQYSFVSSSPVKWYTAWVSPNVVAHDSWPAAATIEIPTDAGLSGAEDHTSYAFTEFQHHQAITQEELERGFKIRFISMTHSDPDDTGVLPSLDAWGFWVDYIKPASTPRVPSIGETPIRTSPAINHWPAVVDGSSTEKTPEYWRWIELSSSAVNWATQENRRGIAIEYEVYAGSDTDYSDAGESSSDAYGLDKPEEYENLYFQYKKGSDGWVTLNTYSATDGTLNGVFTPQTASINNWGLDDFRFRWISRTGFSGLGAHESLADNRTFDHWAIANVKMYSYDNISFSKDPLDMDAPEYSVSENSYPENMWFSIYQDGEWHTVEEYENIDDVLTGSVTRHRYIIDTGQSPSSPITKIKWNTWTNGHWLAENGDKYRRDSWAISNIKIGGLLLSGSNQEYKHTPVDSVGINSAIVWDIDEASQVLSPSVNSGSISSSGYSKIIKVTASVNRIYKETGRPSEENSELIKRIPKYSNYNYTSSVNYHKFNNIVTTDNNGSGVDYSNLAEHTATPGQIGNLLNIYIHNKVGRYGWNPWNQVRKDYNKFSFNDRRSNILSFQVSPSCPTCPEPDASRFTEPAVTQGKSSITVAEIPRDVDRWQEFLANAPVGRGEEWSNRFQHQALNSSRTRITTKSPYGSPLGNPAYIANALEERRFVRDNWIDYDPITGRSSTAEDFWAQDFSSNRTLRSIYYSNRVDPEAESYRTIFGNRERYPSASYCINQPHYANELIPSFLASSIGGFIGEDFRVSHESARDSYAEKILEFLGEQGAFESSLVKIQMSIFPSVDVSSLKTSRVREKYLRAGIDSSGYREHQGYEYLGPMTEYTHSVLADADDNNLFSDHIQSTVDLLLPFEFRNNSQIVHTPEPSDILINDWGAPSTVGQEYGPTVRVFAGVGSNMLVFAGAANEPIRSLYSHFAYHTSSYAGSKDILQLPINKDPNGNSASEYHAGHINAAYNSDQSRDWITNAYRWNQIGWTNSQATGAGLEKNTQPVDACWVGTYNSMTAPGQPHCDNEWSSDAKYKTRGAYRVVETKEEVYGSQLSVEFTVYAGNGSDHTEAAAPDIYGMHTPSPSNSESLWIQYSGSSDGWVTLDELVNEKDKYTGKFIKKSYIVPISYNSVDNPGVRFRWVTYHQFSSGSHTAAQTNHFKWAYYSGEATEEGYALSLNDAAAQQISRALWAIKDITVQEVTNEVWANYSGFYSKGGEVFDVADAVDTEITIKTDLEDGEELKGIADSTQIITGLSKIRTRTSPWPLQGRRTFTEMSSGGYLTPVPLKSPDKYVWSLKEIENPFYTDYLAEVNSANLDAVKTPGYSYRPGDPNGAPFDKMALNYLGLPMISYSSLFPYPFLKEAPDKEKRFFFKNQNIFYSGSESLLGGSTARFELVDQNTPQTGSILNLIGNWQSNSSSLDTRGLRGEGVLQNDYSTYHMGISSLYVTPPADPLYSRRVPQTIIPRNKGPVQFLELVSLDWDNLNFVELFGTGLPATWTDVASGLYTNTSQLGNFIRRTGVAWAAPDGSREALDANGDDMFVANNEPVKLKTLSGNGTGLKLNYYLIDLNVFGWLPEGISGYWPFPLSIFNQSSPGHVSDEAGFFGQPGDEGKFTEESPGKNYKVGDLVALEDPHAGNYTGPPNRMVFRVTSVQPEFKETGDITGLRGFQVLAGDAPWEAGSQSNLEPYPTSYEDFRENFRGLEQNKSLVPEFIISSGSFLKDYLSTRGVNRNGFHVHHRSYLDFLDNYRSSAGYPSISDDPEGADLGRRRFIDYRNDDKLSLHGSSIDLYSDPDTGLSNDTPHLESFYSTSELSSSFGLALSILQDPENARDNSSASRLSLKATAVKKLLPYEGFYPAERTVQLAALFKEDYVSPGFWPQVMIGDLDKNEIIKLKLSASLNPVMKPLFSPGILFNSIKTGLAVDYPMYENKGTGSMSLASVMPATGTDSLGNDIESYVRLKNTGSFINPYGLHPIDNPLYQKYMNTVPVPADDPGGTVFTPAAGHERSGSSGVYPWAALPSGGSPYGLSITGSWFNGTEDFSIPRLKSSVSPTRIPFEAIYNPMLIDEFQIYDNEPHPSASLCLGGYNYWKIMDSPYIFNSLNKDQFMEKWGWNPEMNLRKVRSDFTSYSLAMNNFLAESVDIFNKDGNITTIRSNNNSNWDLAKDKYAMRVYLRNDKTLMYDRHSSFGPPVDVQFAGGKGETHVHRTSPIAFENSPSRNDFLVLSSSVTNLATSQLHFTFPGKISLYAGPGPVDEYGDPTGGTVGTPYNNIYPGGALDSEGILASDYPDFLKHCFILRMGKEVFTIKFMDTDGIDPRIPGAGPGSVWRPLTTTQWITASSGHLLEPGKEEGISWERYNGEPINLKAALRPHQDSAGLKVNAGEKIITIFEDNNSWGQSLKTSYQDSWGDPRAILETPTILDFSKPFYDSAKIGLFGTGSYYDLTSHSPDDSPFPDPLTAWRKNEGSYFYDRYVGFEPGKTSMADLLLQLMYKISQIVGYFYFFRIKSQSGLRGLDIEGINNFHKNFLSPTISSTVLDTVASFPNTNIISIGIPQHFDAPELLSKDFSEHTLHFDMAHIPGDIEAPNVYNAALHFHGPPPSQNWLDIYSDFGALHYSLQPQSNAIGIPDHPSTGVIEGYRRPLLLSDATIYGSRASLNSSETSQSGVYVTRHWIGNTSTMYGGFAPSMTRNVYYGSIPDATRFSIDLSHVSGAYESENGPLSTESFNGVPTYVNVWHRPHLARREDDIIADSTIFKGVGWGRSYDDNYQRRFEWSKYLPYWVGIEEQPTTGHSEFNVMFPLEETKIDNSVRLADSYDLRGYKHKSDNLEFLSSKRFFDNIAGMANSTVLHFSGSEAYWEDGSGNDAKLHVFDYRALGLQDNLMANGASRVYSESAQQNQKSGQTITISDGENSIVYEFCACDHSDDRSRENMIPYSCESETEISYSARKTSSTGLVDDNGTPKVALADDPYSNSVSTRRDAPGYIILELATKINRSKLKIMAAPITAEYYDRANNSYPGTLEPSPSATSGYLGTHDLLGMEQYIGDYLNWKSLMLMPETSDVKISITEAGTTATNQFGAAANTLEIIEDLFKIKAKSISDCTSMLETKCDASLLLEASRRYSNSPIVVSTYQPWTTEPQSVIGSNSHFLSVSSSATPSTVQYGPLVSTNYDPYILLTTPDYRFNPAHWGTRQTNYILTGSTRSRVDEVVDSDTQRGSEVKRHSFESLANTDSPGRFGFDPYVPPYLDRREDLASSPYVDIILDYSGVGDDFDLESLKKPAVLESHLSFETSNGSYDYKSLAGTAYESAMSLTASLDIFNIVPNFSDPQDEGNFSSVVWTIAPKWETPVLDFSDSEQTVQKIIRLAPSGKETEMDGQYQIVSEKTTTIPYDGSNPSKLYLTSSKGMWHQYSNINSGYDLIIGAHPDGGQYKSLAKAVGFTPNAEEPFIAPLGKVRGSEDSSRKVISEALVVIPFQKYYDDNGEEQYRTIPFHFVRPDSPFPVAMTSHHFYNYVAGLVKRDPDTNALTPNEELINDIRLDPGIQMQVELMHDFVIPPQYDFLKSGPGPRTNSMNQETAVMFILPFYHELTEEDVVNWWQNLPPGIANNPQISESHASHSLYSSDAINGTNDVVHPYGILDPGDKIVGLTSEILLEDLKWKVFKVKKRAKQSYYGKLLDSYLGEEFDASKIKEILSNQRVPQTLATGHPLTQELKRRRDTSWNWPYDYFSLIELVNVDTKLNVELDQGPAAVGSEFGVKHQYGISKKFFNIAKRLRDYGERE